MNFKTQTLVGAGRLTQFVERIERLKEEKRTLLSNIKDVYSEAKADVFKARIMRQVIKLRSMDSDVLNEHDEHLEIYRNALGLR